MKKLVKSTLAIFSVLAGISLLGCPNNNNPNNDPIDDPVVDPKPVVEEITDPVIKVWTTLENVEDWRSKNSAGDARYQFVIGGEFEAGSELAFKFKPFAEANELTIRSASNSVKMFADVDLKGMEEGVEKTGKSSDNKIVLDEDGWYSVTAKSLDSKKETQGIGVTLYIDDGAENLNQYVLVKDIVFAGVEVSAADYESSSVEIKSWSGSEKPAEIRGDVVSEAKAADAVTLYNVVFKYTDEADEEKTVSKKATAGRFVKFPVFNRTGYSIAWYTDAELTNEYKADSKVTADLELFGKWTESAKYTVKFISNTDTELEDSSVYNGYKVTKPAAEKAHYTLTGWFLADAEGAATEKEWDFASDVVTEDVVLVAVWTENPKYEVLFDANGGTFGDLEGIYLEVYQNETVDMTNVPVKDGCVFTGWYTSDDVAFTASTKITAPVTFYAHWAAADSKVKVTFDTTTNFAGNTVSFDEQELTPGTKASDPSYAGTREGYVFFGWFTTADPDLDTDSAFDFDTEVSADTTLYAVWGDCLKVYTVGESLGSGRFQFELDLPESAVFGSGKEFTFKFKANFAITSMTFRDITAGKKFADSITLPATEDTPVTKGDLTVTKLADEGWYLVSGTLTQGSSNKLGCTFSNSPAVTDAVVLKDMSLDGTKIDLTQLTAIKYSGSAIGNKVTNK